MAYLAAYFAASAADLTTTEMAIRAGGAEANVYVTDAGSYLAARALLLTGAGGIAMAALFALGHFYADRVAPIWLEHPITSFGRVYLNPWSRIERSPLHAVSYAIAFVALRFLAAGNNICIVAGLKPPIGTAVRAIGYVTTQATGFVLVVGTLYLLLVVTLSPLAANVIRRYLRMK
jgi:hypothetical protein